MPLFVLNIIMANVVKKCSEIKFHTERPIKLSAIPCKKEKRTSEVFSPGNYALLCLVLFHDLTLGVGAYGVKIKSLTRQNDEGFSITPPPFTHSHPTLVIGHWFISVEDQNSIRCVQNTLTAVAITYELAIDRRSPHLGQFLLKVNST